MHAEDREIDAVGATALGIARARAEESRRPDRLFDDPYAERFVAAGGDLSPFGDAAAGGGASARAWALLLHHVAVRTRFFDDHLTDAVAAGCRQVVLVAAGLDARGLRLSWPSGVHLFELDQGPVLAFKERVLRGRAPAGGGRRTLVPVDLRQDWPAALVEAGFEPGRPAAWLVEGLFPALSPADSDRLLERLGTLAAPGSWIAYDDTGDPALVRPLLAELDPALVPLWKGGPGGEPAAWLGGRGWDAEVVDQEEAAQRYGRAPATGALRPRLVRARRR